MSIVDQIKKAVENAPDALTFPKLNYGQVTVTLYKLQFHGKGVKPDRIVVGDDEELPEGTVTELNFVVDIKHFNPELDFNYERSVALQNSGKDRKTDWTEIVEPSLVSVFGENWWEKVKDSWVEVEDVDQVNPSIVTDKATNEKVEKTYQTIKFLRVFKSEEECLAARNATYKKSGQEVAAVESEISEETKGEVRKLVKAFGKEKALKMLEQKPFGDYEPEVLLAASNPL